MAKENQELAELDDFGTELQLPPELAAELEAAGAVLSGSCVLSTTKIGYKKGGGKWRLPDEQETERFTGVIVAAKHANIHYPGAYVAGAATGADCVAVRFGQADVSFDKLAPIPDVSAPYCVSCAGCEKLKWGSAANGGNGKACAETMVMAVYVPQLGDDLFIVEARRKWANNAEKYLNMTSTKYRAPIAVLTEFKLGSENSVWEQTYRTVQINKPELMANLLARREEANSLIDAHVRNTLEAAAAGDALPGTPVVAEGREARER